MATTLPCRASKPPPSLPESVGCAPHRNPLSLVNVQPTAFDATDRFLDAQLGDLCALQRRAERIHRRLQRRLEACLAGQRPITVLLAPLLVGLLHDTQRLTDTLGTVVATHRRSLQQAQASQNQLATGGEEIA